MEPMKDAKHEKAVEPPAARHWFDLAVTIILAVAAIGTAWAGYQSTKWGGTQADAYASASAVRLEGSLKHTQAGQERIVDVVTFTQWLNALNNEILAGTTPRPAAGYVPQQGTVSGFLFERFRPEFRPAVDAWLATQPFLNAAAPASPFVMPAYRISADDVAQQLDERADQLAAKAREANQLGDNYVLTAVFFALVLFFAGTASRARSASTQMGLLVFGAVALSLIIVVMLLTFPIQM
jgi:hypothetical protein